MKPRGEKVRKLDVQSEAVQDSGLRDGADRSFSWAHWCPVGTSAWVGDYLCPALSPSDTPTGV